MPIGTRIPYPPCDSVPCTGDRCAAYLPKDAKRFVWPELVGVKAEVAKAQIEKDNPYVTVVIERVILFDTCRNRVFLRVNDNGIVTALPQVG